jgi:hypothetical protein
MNNHQEPELRLVDGPCPRCGCHMVRLFDCDCGEVHSDYCVNCGRFTSLGATEHTEMSEYDAPCVKGLVMHDHVVRTGRSLSRCASEEPVMRHERGADPDDQGNGPENPVFRRGMYYAARLDGFEDGFTIWQKVGDGAISVFLGKDLADIRQLIADLEQAGIDEEWRAATMLNPPHGTLSETHPPHALPLESGCDWGNCSRRGALWRFLGPEDLMGPIWIVVCRRCSKKPSSEGGTSSPGTGVPE